MLHRPKELADSPIKGPVTPEDEERMRVLLPIHLAPKYLQHNPFILHGYRGYLTTKLCIERFVLSLINCYYFVIQLSNKIFLMTAYFGGQTKRSIFGVIFWASYYFVGLLFTICTSSILLPPSATECFAVYFWFASKWVQWQIPRSIDIVIWESYWLFFIITLLLFFFCRLAWFCRQYTTRFLAGAKKIISTFCRMIF